MSIGDYKKAIIGLLESMEKEHDCCVLGIEMDVREIRDSTGMFTTKKYLKFEIS